ncbi:hypothetical protein ACVINW_000319 [Bradyrhizobium sp. USDA 4461]
MLAVDAAHAKSFLAAHDVRFQEDDRSQISGTVSRAHRAASILGARHMPATMTD